MCGMSESTHNIAHHKFRSAKGVHLFEDRGAAFSSEDDVITQVFQGTPILRS